MRVQRVAGRPPCFVRKDGQPRGMPARYRPATSARPLGRVELRRARRSPDRDRDALQRRRPINFDEFQALAHHLVDHGSDGLVVAGTTGESPTLSDDEKLELFPAAIDAVGSRATVVAGTGTHDRSLGAAHRARARARRRRVPRRDAVLQQAAAARDRPPLRGDRGATDKPVVVYNIPSRVVVNIEPETIVALAEIESVRAVKQANDDLEQARRILAPASICTRATTTSSCRSSSSAGSAASASTPTSRAPRSKRWYAAARTATSIGARELNEEMAPAYDLFTITTNPIPIKAALNLLGHEVGGYRLPMSSRPSTSSSRSAGASPVSASSSAQAFRRQGATVCFGP